jgi:hypothetical protein
MPELGMIRPMHELILAGTDQFQLAGKVSPFFMAPANTCHIQRESDEGELCFT